MKKNFTVRRGALEGIDAFLAVARHRNFRRAAAELGVTPSAAGQAVRALETRLGVALFLRTTRSVGLTEAGERFLAEAEPAYLALAAAGAAASGLGSTPAGLLRITVPRSVVPLMLRPIFASFAAAYPEIELEVVVSDEFVDIASQGFDAGMRLGQFIAKDMIALRLTPPFRLVVVASPDYLSRRGTPKTVEDLQDHACLRLRRTWPTRSSLSTNATRTPGTPTGARSPGSTGRGSISSPAYCLAAAPCSISGVAGAIRSRQRWSHTA
jgi:DNA-binding transcriptional LysR family regulator